MTITEVFQKITSGEMAGWALMALILLLSLIQISPLKLNPWDRIFGWIGKKTQGELHKQVADLQKQITDIWISSHRQCWHRGILTIQHRFILTNNHRIKTANAPKAERIRC